MKKVLFLLLLFWYGASLAQTPVEMNRDLYIKAASEQRYAEELLESSRELGAAGSMLHLGYQGAANMMMAKHVGNPFSKLSYFKKGKKLLQKAIEEDGDNLELRFLRFSVQSKAPAFLGYRAELEEDKEFILAHFEALQDPQLKEMVRVFLLESEQISEVQKREL